MSQCPTGNSLHLLFSISCVCVLVCPVSLQNQMPLDELVSICGCQLDVADDGPGTEARRSRHARIPSPPITTSLESRMNKNQPAEENEVGPPSDESPRRKRFKHEPVTHGDPEIKLSWCTNSMTSCSLYARGNTKRQNPGGPISSGASGPAFDPTRLCLHAVRWWGTADECVELLTHISYRNDAKIERFPGSTLLPVKLCKEEEVRKRDRDELRGERGSVVNIKGGAAWEGRTSSGLAGEAWLLCVPTGRIRCGAWSCGQKPGKSPSNQVTSSTVV